MARLARILPLFVLLAFGVYVLTRQLAGSRRREGEAATGLCSCVMNSSAAIAERRAYRALLTTSPSRRRPAPGTLAPELIFNDRAGRLFQLSHMRGKVVVLSFWGIGRGLNLESQACLNCVAKMFAGQAVVVALDVQDMRASFAAWVLVHPQFSALLFAIPISPNERGVAIRSYDLTSQETYVIDRNGKIVARVSTIAGTTDLENAVRDALKK